MYGEKNAANIATTLNLIDSLMFALNILVIPAWSWYVIKATCHST